MGIFTKKMQSWENYIKAEARTNIINTDKTIQDKLTMLGIHKEILTDVRKAAMILEPYKEKIVRFFYDRIYAIHHLQQLINKYSTLEKMYKTMEKYIDQFFRAEITKEYINTRIRVGRVHSRIHLSPDYFISGHHLLLQFMTSIIIEKMQKQPEQMVRMILAVQKLAAFDQQLIVSVYTEDTLKKFLYHISDIIDETTAVDETKELIDGMNSQIEETENVTAATDEMSTSIQEVANYAMEAEKGTNEALQSVLKSKEIIEKATGHIEALGKVYDSVTGNINRLEKEIENTHTVINVMNKIADQTNLLALNASIEAARSGEQGRGFSVVAKEIRKLSEHTKVQIGRITENMYTLHHVATTVIDEIEQTGNLVRKSVTGAEATINEITKIVSMMDKINESSSIIASMTRKQADTIIEIANMNETIREQSELSRKAARNTARIVFEISKKMDYYRINLIKTKMNFDLNDYVRIAKTDHLLWKWRVYNMMLDIETLSLQDLASYKSCRFGKWYYSNDAGEFKNSNFFKKLEQPHKEIHHFVHLAAEQYRSGEWNRLEETYDYLETASELLLKYLSGLQEEHIHNEK